MSLDMLLLDSKSTMMPATVNVNRLAAHRPNLEAGVVYSLTVNERRAVETIGVGMRSFTLERKKPYTADGIEALVNAIEEDVMITFVLAFHLFITHNS
ncbi:unnamed protein product [Eruca vesicaria subsp. sativa]|uniref:Uncharacterized protein n=1 Tax=Eruca vesicaria subsp. sativa TaxID=29727 RepID=A0ABC8LQD7_ERUVS|nr:unnamed protein product [Eruca vesicaria subsp. sativa]